MGSTARSSDSIGPLPVGTPLRPKNASPLVVTGFGERAWCLPIET
jgi:hypothetical protein